jgi:hypothetical protein
MAGKGDCLCLDQPIPRNGSNRDQQPLGLLEDVEHRTRGVCCLSESVARSDSFGELGKADHTISDRRKASLFSSMSTASVL